MAAMEAYLEGIETERLYLRPLTVADISVWTRQMADTEAVRFLMLGSESPEKVATDWIERQLGRYAAGRFGLQAIHEKETGDFVGQCGLITQDVDGVEELEVGYHLFRQYWGRGYASEAAQAWKNYAFARQLKESVISIIHPQNFASQAVAKCNGMTLEKQTIFKDITCCIFRITRQQWLANQGII